jgi:drug/metabolite transporter (DMT)-like permease
LTSPSASILEKTWFAYAILVFTTLCWGFNAVFGKLIVGEISPMAIVSIRWFGVAVLLLVFFNRPVRRDWPQLRKHLLFFSIMGIVGYASFNALFYVASHSTSGVNIGILQGSIPIFVFFGAFVAFRTPVTLMQAAGVSVAFIGVVIVASAGDIANLRNLTFNIGDLIMIVACSLYAAYTVGLRNRPQVSAMGMFTVMAGAAFLASLPMVAIEVYSNQFLAPSPKGWVYAGLITLFPSFLAQLSFIHAVKLIGPGRAGVMVNLAPIFASGLSVLILSEPFKLFHGMALVLVLGGILLSERGKPKT